MTPGTKVICVDDQFPEWVHHVYLQLPKKDLQYVIRAVTGGVTHEGGKRKPTQVVYLVGVFNPISEISGQEFGFHPRRFRLLDDLKREAREKAHHTESHNHNCDSKP